MPKQRKMVNPVRRQKGKGGGEDNIPEQGSKIHARTLDGILPLHAVSTLNCVAILIYKCTFVVSTFAKEVVDCET